MAIQIKRVYGAKDPKINHAIILKSYLEAKALALP